VSQPPSYPEGAQPSPQGAPLPVKLRLPAEKPTVAYALMGITIVVYLLQLATQSLLVGYDLPAVLGVKSNELIIAGQLWRLFTPMLLHASIIHIGLNMYALFIFGPGLERNYGHGRFLTLYLLAGFAGNVMSFIFSTANSLGASTAIFGLLGAEAVFLYQNRKIFGRSAQRALVNLVTIAVINLIIGLQPGIDNWGHIGGLLGGVLFAWFGGPVLSVEGIYPDLEVVDSRPRSQSYLAAIIVGLLFAGLALLVIFMRR
jgi:rhomboid protease GluP